jgi:hypothetical protein
MDQQAGHDLFQGPLSVTELEAAGRWHGVELIVGQASEEAEGVSSSRQPFEQAVNVDVLRGVVALGRAIVITFGVATRRMAAGGLKA